MTDSTLDPVLRSRLIEVTKREIEESDLWAEGRYSTLFVGDCELRDWLAAAVVDALGIEEGGVLIDGVPYTPEDMAAHLPLAVPPGTNVASWFRIRAAEASE